MMTPSPDRYEHLCDRAVEFVRGRGGMCAEDELIAFVFGAASVPKLWRPLLERLLGGEPALRRVAGDRWMLVDKQAGDGLPLLDRFVAVDVETTGLRPDEHRIIEIGAARYEGGAVVERFATYVNPERRVPGYITKLTGITDSEVIPAPRFSVVADAFLNFVGDDPILGHNVGFDLRFLNAELARCNRPTLVNLPIDTMRLAMRVLARVRRPSLDTVAKEVGLAPRRLHRALSDAELAAEAGIRLALRAQDGGVRSLEQLLGFAAPFGSDGMGGSSGSVLDRRHLAALPRTPGVYIMRDALGAVIYVGKAKDIRERVASYYAQPLGKTRRMDGLIESIARIDAVETGSELCALLLESQLIKRYSPRYNTQLRHTEEYPFIKVDIGNPWPRVTVERRRRADGALYFGPYRSRSVARETVELLNRSFKLRTCPRSFKNKRSFGSPCLELDLKRCPGPCVGRADSDEYRAEVREVVRFLSGHEDAFQRRIMADIQAAAERLDFEAARLKRRDLEVLQRVVEAQQRIHEAERSAPVLLALPSAAPHSFELLVVVQGRRWAQLTVAPDDAMEAVAARLARSWERLQRGSLIPIDHDSIDEMSILARWIERSRSEPWLVTVPEESPDWTGLARRVLEGARSVSREGLPDRLILAAEDVLLVERIEEADSEEPHAAVVAAAAAVPVALDGSGTAAGA